MADIGETLRETRMRRRIDISEVETATKIRAKYLRALENEEWDLLPGPTFVTTFLRTYAEYLELDERLLVAEYRQRYERPSAHEMAPLAPLGGRRDRRPVRSGPGPGVVVGVVLALLVGVLFLVGKVWPTGTDKPRSPERVVPPQGAGTPAAATGGAHRPSERRHAAPRVVRVQITARGVVNVCLVDARGRRLVNSRNLAPGQGTRIFRGARFKVALGNNLVRLRVDGRTIAVPARANPVGYDLRPGRRPRELAPDAQPRCA